MSVGGQGQLCVGLGPSRSRSTETSACSKGLIPEFSGDSNPQVIRRANTQAEESAPRPRKKAATQAGGAGAQSSIGAVPQIERQAAITSSKECSLHSSQGADLIIKNDPYKDALVKGRNLCQEAKRELVRTNVQHLLDRKDHGDRTLRKIQRKITNMNEAATNLEKRWRDLQTGNMTEPEEVKRRAGRAFRPEILRLMPKNLDPWDRRENLQNELDRLVRCADDRDTEDKIRQLTRAIKEQSQQVLEQDQKIRTQGFQASNRQWSMTTRANRANAQQNDPKYAVGGPSMARADDARGLAVRSRTTGNPSSGISSTGPTSSTSSGGLSHRSSGDGATSAGRSVANGRNTRGSVVRDRATRGLSQAGPSTRVQVRKPRSMVDPPCDGRAWSRPEGGNYNNSEDDRLVFPTAAYDEKMQTGSITQLSALDNTQTKVAEGRAARGGAAGERAGESSTANRGAAGTAKLGKARIKTQHAGGVASGKGAEPSAATVGSATRTFFLGGGEGGKGVAGRETGGKALSRDPRTVATNALLGFYSSPSAPNNPSPAPTNQILPSHPTPPTQVLPTQLLPPINLPPAPATNLPLHHPTPPDSANKPTNLAYSPHPRQVHPAPPTGPAGMPRQPGLAPVAAPAPVPVAAGPPAAVSHNHQQEPPSPSFRAQQRSRKRKGPEPSPSH